MENKNINYDIGTKVVLKKQHPCGSNEWEITRLGADLKLKCLKCGRTILMPRIEFNKKIKRINLEDGKNE